ncbi:MAG: hypothetical protein N2449_02370 [Bacteroidales bacterium]|nr:hypothetical protein [Bacteroidales bacterium]
MKKKDLVFLLIAMVIVFPYLPFGFLNNFQSSFLYNEEYWIVTSFIKFAFLATLGEVIGLRIRTGNYYEKGFGLIPRMLVWGVLGLTIKIAFVVYAAGIPVLIEKYFWISGAKDSMAYKDIFEASEHGLGGVRFLAAFLISTIMNLTYAPVMMTFHKITDTHIMQQGGSLIKFFSPIPIRQIFPTINWDLQWNFIFKKTIPLFWIPMQTINFMVASEYRVVIAAFLGIVLGILLSIATPKK